MGWDGYKGNHSAHQQAKRIHSELNSDWESLKHEIKVESANEFTHYLAVRDNKEAVTAFVVLVETDDEWTRYKWLHEVEHPYAYGASKKLISLLTPTDSENAHQWRETCAGVRHPITGGQA